MKPILEVHNISKQFFIDHENVSYYSFRDRLSSFYKSSPKREEFWALKDVSFNVMPGESIGIIGRNGAGKSTLLKILSKITPPTQGQIIVRGHIASLLEVGTGFHQELTGRENIFMNGSILGMKKAEIKSRFDEIVDFSGVEKFLDTPLKHYSSGMQLRLAFAVAAHLDPEILIIDEVLAVGDASFQRKCFQKMENINSQGRTILFVSHNMVQVNLLCKKGILLGEGRVLYQGEMQDTIAAYLNASIRNDRIDVGSLPRAGIKSNELRIKALKLIEPENREFHEGEAIDFEIEFDVYDTIRELVLGLSLTDFYGNNIVECRSTSTINKIDAIPGSYKISVNFKPLLASGIFNLNLGARSAKGHLEYIPSVMTIEIIPSKNGYEEWNKPSAGVLLVNSKWKLETISQ